MMINIRVPSVFFHIDIIVIIVEFATEYEKNIFSKNNLSRLVNNNNEYILAALKEMSIANVFE